MRLDRELVAKVIGSRKELPINGKSFLGYKKIVDANDYSIYERPLGASSISAIYQYTVVKQINSKCIDLYPDLRTKIKYRIRLNENIFPGIWKESKISACLLLPYLRVIKQDTYVQSLRLCIITDKGQIFHNYPARNKEFEGISKSGDIVNFEESVVWDLPNRKYPSENLECDETEEYYPNLPKECYQYHPLPNDDVKFKDSYENGGFPKKKIVLDDTGNFVPVSRFYQHSRNLQANSFRFMGSPSRNYKMNLLGTYCSNVDVGVRTCIFASDDGGRQWYCKYEFSDFGEYDFQQGHTGEWGKNWGNPIIISDKEYIENDVQINVLKRNLILPKESDLKNELTFQWDDIGCVKSLYQEKNKALTIIFNKPHGLKNGNIVSLQSDNKNNMDFRIKWLVNSKDSDDTTISNMMFKIEVLSDMEVRIYELVSSRKPTLPCRHIHHINRIKDGWLIGTGEIYPNSWVLYFQMKHADTYSVINASGNFPILRLNTSSESIQRTMGVIISDEDKPLLLYASDHDLSKRDTILGSKVARNSTGVFLGKLENIDNRNKMKCIFEAEEPSFYFANLENMVLFSGQRGEIGICFDHQYEKWYREHISGPIVHYMGKCHQYFVFDNNIIMKK